MSQFRGNTGTLIVVVSRAKDLPNKRKLEKQNPYCLLRIANLTDKTKADLRGGQVPRWNEEFRFHVSPEVSPILKVSVLDETKKAPTLISEAEIDFTPVFYASVKEGYDKWHQLSSGDGREAGEIYIEMTFYPASGSTTFSQSERKMTSSFGSSGGSNMSAASRKRQLPPIPGQEPSAPIVADDEYTIPAPLPRMSSREPSPPIPHQVFHQSMNASQMSVHTLPDVPPPRTSSELPTHRSTSPPQRKPLRFTTTSELPTAVEQERVSSANAFDELEREVQLNFNGHTNTRQTQSKPKPPPVPSHSSGSLKSSTSSYTSLAPPRTNNAELSNTIYSIIEPERSKSSSPTRRSPTRKPPSDFYKSGSTSPARLDLSSIPYDANTIAAHTGGSSTRGTTSFGEKLQTRNDSDLLLETHNAPTPYEAFVHNAGGSTGSNNSMGSSGGRSRMSPSRFKSSLPPPPPPR